MNTGNSWRKSVNYSYNRKPNCCAHANQCHFPHFCHTLKIIIIKIALKKIPNPLNKEFGIFFKVNLLLYIIPYIPPPPPGIDIGLSSFISERTHSVVRSIPAIEAAFSKATRVTLVGSITPASYNFSYLSVRALKP